MVITARRKTTYYLNTVHDGDHSQKKKQHIIWIQKMMVITAKGKTTYCLGTEHDGDHRQKKKKTY